ncbi:oxidoreductase [Paenibacillus pectinilyticus]|uniref:Oxidoreductase n=1 Tax=Paenibacillus pectinilyticus TaxID=512399 RepID=A0A1C0ZVR3_9BACL|nr:Gfo/Idh/MocA family oxidoreductase [Paenibacillus pectinilyticus]OCT12204.1 oxidoreductase [Paenibacillus pectinilyticus]
MQPLRIAVLGMVDGNGHPYSWSAMFNNYDKETMAECPYPAIPSYLAKEPVENLHIPGASVTHIWTDNPADASHVAKASQIPTIVSKPEDVIGHVDAVMITTDKGHEHVERCRPFVEAGLPIFVDKPLVDNEPDLKQFQRWVRDGARIMSSSCMRYCKEFMPYRTSIHSLGQLRFTSITTCKSWERYGIHALESIYPILGPGFISAQNTGTKERNIVLFKHRTHGDVAVIAIDDMYGSHGMLQLCGTSASAAVTAQDTFYSFKAQLEAFNSYLRTGERPFPFQETEELMRMVIAGIRSREEGGRVVLLEDIAAN